MKQVRIDGTYFYNLIVRLWTPYTMRGMFYHKVIPLLELVDRILVDF